MASAGTDTPLTEQQEKFVQAYARRTHGTKAAIAAGYAPANAAQQASFLLSLGKIQDALAKEKEKLGIRLDVTRLKWLEELRRVAFADLTRIAEWDGDGLRHKPSEDIDEEDSAAVQSVKSEKRITMRDGDTEETVKMEVKLHDKTKALDMLGRHFGFFSADKADGPGKVILTAEQAKQILNADFATQKPAELPKVEPL